jgi:hypothetical protein
MTKNPPKIPFKAEALAKAELVAKASFERKHSSIEVIPPDVTRAKTSAWLDFISPFTQWAGLKGDQLRNKRELLRIEQEATLDRIVSQARTKIASDKLKTSPIPSKFLVPFLERASLEQDNSNLCDRWSDLLVSAATEFDPSMIRFSAVLAEMGPAEAALLRRMVKKPRGKRDLNHIEDVPFLFSYNVIERAIETETPARDSEQALFKAIIQKFEYPGTVWPFLAVEFAEFRHPKWTDKDDAIASNLVSLGVLHLVEGLEGVVGKLNWYGRVYALTRFGLRFLLACDLMIKDELARVEQALMKVEKDASDT